MKTLSMFLIENIDSKINQLTLELDELNWTPEKFESIAAVQAELNAYKYVLSLIDEYKLLNKP